MTLRRIATFTVREEMGVKHVNYPVVTGVPIAPGKVTSADTLCISDESDQLLEGDVQATARWADGSIKWALVTLPAFSANALSSCVVHLCESTADEGMSSSQVIALVTDEAIKVDTGRLRFRVCRQGPWIQSIECLVGGVWQERVTCVDHVLRLWRDKNEHVFNAASSTREIAVESAGRARVVVAVRGEHRSDNGETFGPYVLRVECLAGSPQLRFTHSLIFDGDPENEQLQASEIFVHSSLGKAEQFAFGGDAGAENWLDRQRATYSADFRYAEMFQDSVSHWRLERWVHEQNRAVFCDEGIRADGWVFLRGTEGVVTAAIRECWQNHPTSLYVDADSGVLRLGLYARRAEPLNLRRYSDQVYSYTYECPSFKQYEPTLRDPAYSAHGIRKTHSFALMFDEANPSRAALFYNNPLRLRWPAEYTQQCAVVEPAGLELSKAATDSTDKYLAFLKDEMLCSGGTGYIDYFDLPHGFNLRTHRWHHDWGGWGYLNNEGLPVLGFWQAWLLTGHATALQMCLAMARHNTDIDSFHIGRFAGLGGRHNITHWADQDREPRISQPIGKRFAYYITGDRSYLDLIDPMLAMWNKRFAKSYSVDVHATIPALVATLLTAEETGIRSCEAWLRVLADGIAASIDERGVLAGRLNVGADGRACEPDPGAPPCNFMMFSMFGGAQIFAELAERYNHAGLRGGLVRFARYQAGDLASRLAIEGNPDDPIELIRVQPDSVNTFRALDLFGYAYLQTGDEVFKQALSSMCDYLPVAIEQRPELRYATRAGNQRVVPVGKAWPDENDPRRVASIKKLLPDFDVPQEQGQFLKIAIWLQKLQGAAVLGALNCETAKSAVTSKTR